MNTEYADTTVPTRPQPVGFIRFHGRDLLIVRHEGIEYTEAKPVSDLCGLFWKSTKRTICTDENAVFYGTTTLLHPEIGSSGITSGPQTGLYMRLDRTRMFMARVSTANVRAKGKPATADFLLALQTEWADALHNYETHGLAIKPGRGSTARDLLQWVRLRNQLNDLHDRRIVDQLIHDELAALGQVAEALEDEQLPLPLPTAA